NAISKNSPLFSFFQSANTYLILDESDSIYEVLWEELMGLAHLGIEEQAVAIRRVVDDVLHRFIAKLNQEIVVDNHFGLSDTDRKNIQRAEQFLNESLFGDFPGIEKTARKVGISSTKLKQDFKSIHKVTLYQYFSTRQMKVAYELLLTKTYSIKELAILFGYDNASKFAAKFQKEMKLLPSQVQ
ncbi:MAG: AraC family transcriptional regulator, partial [Bacteroidota bacterium]|nr:AraC family transcriptional regulator [Bacteroidota bacterium]MDX5430408.1 AraC family transcriptional regulator [Bacteroidota bacterium]MDX5469167.1 AraC family transcriptional regulator [Bacteroidota bacterium]